MCFATLVIMVGAPFYICVVNISKFIARTVTVNTPNGTAPPLVTGTFGSKLLIVYRNRTSIRSDHLVLSRR